MMLTRAGQTWMKQTSVVVIFAIFLSTEVLHRTAVAAEGYSDQLSVFREAFTLIVDNHVTEVNQRELVYGAIQSMLKAIDPDGTFMSPEVYKELQAENQKNFAGIGFEIAFKDHALTVVTPIDGSQAHRAGIRAGDRIISVNNEPIRDMTLVEVVRKLRGPKGSQVTITFFREGREPFELTITRDIIEVKSVRISDILEDGVGYIRVVSFPEGTARDLEEALNGLKSRGMRALILDLRNNPGGLLSQAVLVADLFLEKGKLIVYTQGRGQNQNLRFIDERENPETFPMVVLVNAGSAAGSEIVAGVLQDHQRAILLGEPTFGRGTIQSVIPLSDGSVLRLTTAKFFTPNRHYIHGSGITPDIVVESLGTTPMDLKSDIQLQRATEILKARPL